MADMSKAEKLAAARKRLKEYQQKGKEVQPAGNKPPIKKTLKPQHETEGESPTPPELNSVFDSGPQIIAFDENNSARTPEFSEPFVNLQPAATITGNIDGYFTASHEQAPNQETIELNLHQNGVVQTQSNVFGGYSDVLSVNSQYFNPPTSAFPPFTMPSSGDFSTNSHFSDVASARNFFDYFSAESQNQSSNDMNSVPEVKEPEAVVSAPTEVNIATNLIPLSSSDPNEHLDVSNQSPSNISPTVELNSHESLETQNVETTHSPDLKKVNNMEEVTIRDQVEDLQKPPVTEIFEEVPISSVRSTSESLRQLSLQMNGLIEESSQNSSVHGEDSELERRNQELAAMLATEKQKTEKLELQLKEYQSGMCQLQLDLDQLRTESEARVTRELGPVQEQLQLHIQTVGILVGEKTELQAALTKSQNLAKQKAGEAEELQGRLKASRHKVVELEKEVSTQQETCEKVEKTTRELSSELEKLRQEHIGTNKNLTEKEEEVSELHQKLNTKMNDCAALQRELQEKQSQLSLTQLRVQQLSTTDTSEVDGQLETMHQQKVSLEKQVAELQQTIKSVGAERDQASQQYQQYCKHLNGQVQSLYSQVEALTKENEELVRREQNLLRHVSQMEKQLQLQQQQQQKRKDSPVRSNSEDVAVIEQLQQMLEKKECENKALTEELETQVQMTEEVKRELSEKVDRIEELEATTERLKLDQPDNDKLLAAMESDKLAASRAVGQNRRLKEQLEELQDGFVKMSNDKLVLTEKLQAEQHVCKEQGERLAQQEDELKELRQQLSEKEQQIKKNTSELTNQMMQQSQIADRMRHYEAQGQFHELLQQELELAKERIQALSSQNNELRTLLAQQATHDSGSSSGAGSLDDALSRKDEMMATLSASVRQLELERDQLLERLRQTEQQGKENHQSSPAFQKKTEINGETTEKDYDAMKVAMEQLEERFTRTMKEVADLSDEKQRLEHLVLQLQGETETIGEYIALYQVQRSILRQRAQEKDEQLIKLSRDREEMRNKLGELNDLVHQLVSEKEAIRKISHGVPLEHNNEETPVKHETVSQEDLPNGEIVEITVEKELNEESNLLTPPVEGSKVDTADKIMALLSEIGTSSLVDPQCSENFHPCPWCSGRLITV